jgi:PhnB protein
MAANPIPTGFTTVSPYLMVDDLQGSVDFLIKAFGAKSMGISNGPDGKPMHASLSFGDCAVMLGASMPGHEAFHTMLFIYCNNVDDLFQQALAAGGSQVQPVIDQPWGDRAGAIKDPAGNVWWVATHKEDLSEAEIQERMRQYQKQQSGG